MPSPYDDEEDETPPSKGHNSGNAKDAIGDELRQFLERIEQLRSEMEDIKEQEREVFAEAKGRGFDTKTMREVLKIRKKNKDERDEERMLLETYLAALGID